MIPRRGLQSPNEALQPEPAPLPPPRRRRRQGLLAGLSGFLSFLLVACVAGALTLIAGYKRIREPGPLPDRQGPVHRAGNRRPRNHRPARARGRHRQPDDDARGAHHRRQSLEAQGRRISLPRACEPARCHGYRHQRAPDPARDHHSRGPDQRAGRAAAEGLGRALRRRPRAAARGHALARDLQSRARLVALRPHPHDAGRPEEAPRPDLGAPLARSAVPHARTSSSPWPRSSRRRPARPTSARMSPASSSTACTSACGCNPTRRSSTASSAARARSGAASCAPRSTSRRPTTPTRSTACRRARSPIRAAPRWRRWPTRRARKDLYFVADGTGGHVFAETLDQHAANVARWRQIEKDKAAAEVDRAAPLVPDQPGTPGSGRAAAARPGRPAAGGNPASAARSATISGVSARSRPSARRRRLVNEARLDYLPQNLPRLIAPEKFLGAVQEAAATTLTNALAPRSCIQEEESALAAVTEGVKPAEKPQQAAAATSAPPLAYAMSPGLEERGIKVRGVNAGNDILDGPMADVGAELVDPALVPVSAERRAEQRARAAQLGLPPGLRHAAARRHGARRAEISGEACADAAERPRGRARRLGRHADRSVEGQGLGFELGEDRAVAGRRTRAGAGPRKRGK